MFDKNIFCRKNVTKLVLYDTPDTPAVKTQISMIKCRICSALLKRESDTKLHKLKHEIEMIKYEIKERNARKNSIACDECDMKFDGPNVMKAHKALHKKTHVCHCGKYCKDEKELKCHIKIMHYIRDEEAKEPESKKPKKLESQVPIKYKYRA